MTARVLALAALALFSTAARAETRRIAVVVGNNAGAGEQPPLRFAEVDAGKVARVLTELGGVAPGDLLLLQGQSLATLRAALADAKTRVAAANTNPDDRVVLLFYFSGHSDGEALELGRDRLSFTDLRRWLAGTGAYVRVGIVDSCRSGALLAAKGGRLGPAFQLRLADDLATTGEVLLTSSAADELALESAEVRGSFFTHHLVSGLRGAADSSGDGRVTLAEAYQYAFAHTVSTTAATTVGAQHPAYDYRLAGQGELVLTELAGPRATIEVPRGAERVVVVEPRRDQVVAEVTAGAATVLAVAPGEYAVRAWRGGRIFAGRLVVADGERHTIHWEDLALSAPSAARAKGNLASSTAREPGALLLALGGEAGVADGLGILPALRVAWHGAGPVAGSLSASLASGAGVGFRESSAMLLAGLRAERRLAGVTVFALLEAGGGVVVQTANNGGQATSAVVAAAPGLGAATRFSRRVSLELQAVLPTVLLTRDGAVTAMALPGIWLGIATSI